MGHRSITLRVSSTPKMMKMQLLQFSAETSRPLLTYDGSSNAVWLKDVLFWLTLVINSFRGYFTSKALWWKYRLQPRMFPRLSQRRNMSRPH
jgi:hypothetical protein